MEFTFTPHRAGMHTDVVQVMVRGGHPDKKMNVIGHLLFPDEASWLDFKRQFLDPARRRELDQLNGAA